MTDTNTSCEKQNDIPIKTYVMRAGRMTTGQKKNYGLLYPKFGLDFKKENINFCTLFGNNNPIVVEIGFGMGDATVVIAKNNPDINYLAIDVFKAGVGKVLGKINSMSLSNLKVMEYDAMEILRNMIPDASIQGFHVFFPDPWQKKRHYKRRLMHKSKIELLSSKLILGGYIYMVTDWQDYAHDAFEQLALVQNISSKYEGFAPHQEWRPETAFECKAKKKGHSVFELFFEKK